MFLCLEYSSRIILTFKPSLISLLYLRDIFSKDVEEDFPTSMEDTDPKRLWFAKDLAHSCIKRLSEV